MAPERIISVVDPDARHGHRSRADRYDGYKIHLTVDQDSDLICAVETTRATSPDADALCDLLEADPVTVTEMMGDTAYGSGQTRVEMLNKNVELVAPARPASGKRGKFTKNDFSIDLETGTVTCPAGHTVSPRRHSKSADRFQFRFPAGVCAGCSLRGSCTDSPRGRTLTIGPHEASLQQARAERWTPEFRDRYRQRARVERKAAQIKFRNPKIPWRGLPKAQAWIRLRAAALNLDRIGRLGLLPA